MSSLYLNLRSYLENEYNNTPKKLAQALAALGFIIGLIPTNYQHVGGHPFIIEFLPLISGYNPILGLSTAVGFMVGDIITKPFQYTTIPWWAFIFVHIGVMIYSILPALGIRALFFYIGSRSRFMSDGGIPSISSSTLIYSAIGSSIGAALGLGIVRGMMEFAYIYAPPLAGGHPDTGCLSVAVEHDMFNPGKVSTVLLFTGPLGGVVNYLSNIGLIPKANQLIGGETLGEAVPKIDIDMKGVKSISDLKERVIEKTQKTVGRQLKKTRVVEKVREKHFKEKTVAKDVEGDFPSKDWTPINYNILSNVKTILKERYDLISNLVENKVVKSYLDEANDLLKQWYNAIDAFDLAKSDYMDMLKKAKITMNTVVKPKGFENVTRRFLREKKRVKSIVKESRRVWKKISRIRKGVSLGEFVLETADWVSNVMNIYSDAETFIKEDGESIANAYVKSYLSNYVADQIGKGNEVGLAAMEIVNEVAFDGSEAANIISPSNFFKGSFNFFYDVGKKWLDTGSFNKAMDVIEKRVEKGRYGSLIKHVYNAGREIAEYAKDPKLFKEVLDNKGLGAGLSGETDKLGEFMDGVYKRIDEVFKVSDKSFKVTKVAAGTAKTIVKGWAKLAEFTVRGITSLFR